MAVFNRAGDVAAEVKSRMQSISVANGFETDIGSQVFAGRRRIPADDELPAAVITEGDDFPDDNQNTRIKNLQTYLLDGFDVCDANNPNDKAHAMIRDMKKAMFGDGITFNTQVRKVTYLGRDIGPRPDGLAFVQARIMIQVEYAEDLAHP